MEIIIKETICPCNICIVKPICRCKTYMDLFFDCTFLEDYMPGHFDSKERDQLKLSVLENTLKPIKWTAMKCIFSSGKLVIYTRDNDIL